MRTQEGTGSAWKIRIMIARAGPLELSLEGFTQAEIGKARLARGRKAIESTITEEMIHSGHCRSFGMDTGLERG